MNDFDEIRRQLNLLNDRELLSILREHDEDQWRPEVFDIVRSILNERGVSSGGNSGDEQGTPKEEDVFAEAASLDLVTIGNYVNYVDAETDRLALEARGLKAWIFNKYAPPMESIQAGIQLQVQAEDLIAAMRILESEPVPSSDLPAEIAEPPCPKCGSRDVTEGTEILEPSAALASSSPSQVWLYRCASCGYKWTGE